MRLDCVHVVKILLHNCCLLCKNLFTLHHQTITTMRTLLITIISALVLTACSQTERQVKVHSYTYGEEIVTVDFATVRGQVIRVSGGEGYEYSPKDIVQHIGHVAQIIED